MDYLLTVSYSTKKCATAEKTLDLSKFGAIIKSTKVSYDTNMTGGDISVATSTAIQKILEDLRSAIDQKNYSIYPRKEFSDTLTRLGITRLDALDEIYTLEEKHYHKGPAIDYEFPKSDRVWVFKKRIAGEIVYIKFLVAYQHDREAQVISFHLDR